MPQRRLRQVVDASSALWASLIAGAVFLVLLLVVVPMSTGGNAWTMTRLIASLFLGGELMDEPKTFDLTALLVTLGLHFVCTIAAGFLLSAVVYRGGLIVGIVVGAIIGLGLYLINRYLALSLLDLIGFENYFEWLVVMRSPAFILSHVVFGALVGGVYELLEVEEYVTEDGEPAKPAEAGA